MRSFAYLELIENGIASPMEDKFRFDKIVLLTRNTNKYNLF